MIRKKGSAITVAARAWPLLLPLLVAWQSAGAAPSDEIQQRLDANDAASAYQIGVVNSDEYAGDIEFDFYFGLAAIESGHAERAVFALERVLMQQPDNQRARLELARAQFMLGDDLAARTNFQAVLADAPPPNVRKHIQLFLDKIDERLSRAQSHVSGHAQLTLGSDSNINSATSNTSVDVPALGQVTLADTSREINDEFLTVDAGGDWKYLLSKLTGVFASAAVKDQNNFSSHEYDTTVLGIRTGLSHVWGKNRFELPLQYQELWVDGNSFRRMVTLGGEWGRGVSDHDRLSLYGQLGGLRYPDQGARDVDLSLAGGAWTHNFSGDKLTTISSVYYGDESAKEAVGKHNGRSYYGLRLGAQWTFTPTQALFAVAGAQKVDHAAVHPVFAETRSDDFYQASLGWRWQANNNLSLQAEFEYYDNQSNLPLYAYNRSVAQLSLQYSSN